MYEDEYLDEELDDELDEGLDEEYEDDGSSNSNISDRIKESLNKRNQDDDLKDDIENAKNKDEKDNKSSPDDNKTNKDNNKQPENKKNQPQQKPNDPKNKLNGNDSGSNEIKDKLNNAKQKAKQNNPATKKPEVKLPKSTSNSGSMAKEGLKEGAKKGGKVAAEAGKKGAEAAAKGAQAVGKGLIQILSKLPPQVWIVIGVIIAVIFFTTLLVVFVGALDDTNSSYTYDPTSTDKNEFMCAMVNPTTNKKEMTNNKVTSFFGHRNIDYGSKYHKGVDLGMPDGAEIYAVQDGKVIYRGIWGTGGYTIQIKHENGFTTLYLHMKKFGSFSVGDKIRQGDVVGYAGGTGSNAPAYQFGVHLHIGIKDENDQFFSLNPFFGISDVGYEECLQSATPSIGGTACSIQNAKRKANKIDFQNEVCSKYNTSQDEGGKGSKNGFDFVKKLEGTTKKCTIDGKDGYMTENIGDGTVTVGFGFTNYPIGKQKYTDIINKSGYSKLFIKNGQHYKMKVGVCIPQTLADDMAKLEYNEKVESVKKKVQSYDLKMNEHQLAALTSFVYQNGPKPLDKLLKAYKYYNDTKHTNYKKCKNKYEGIWSKMSLYFNPGTKFEQGLKKRRKAEFALFVTGDYTDKGKFYSRGLDNYAYYDSEGVMSRIK